MAGRFLEDFAVGQTFRSGTLRISGSEIVGFASVYDSQPFHLDDGAARGSLFGGLAASGWHTAALTMKLLLASDFSPAGGIIGIGFSELRWPKPVRPDDELHVEVEVLEVRRSRSNPAQGLVTSRTTTLNGAGEAVQISVGTILVPARQGAPA